MITLTAAEGAAALGLETLPFSVQGVSIDSRSLRSGDLFVAIKGERFDGHDFVAQALDKGACGAVVESSRRECCAAVPACGRGAAAGLGRARAEALYPVDDTLTALGALARAVRRKSTATVIAVTGSVGKTGTKDLIAAMAARSGPTLATSGNQNNEIGLPLTLLALDSETAVAVVEMGMRGRGQIAALCRVAEPDVGVITNIHPVHLELLGSLEAIAEAKAEICQGVRAGGRVVLPVREPVLERVACAAGRAVVHFAAGLGREIAEVFVENKGRVGAEGSRLEFAWPGGRMTIDAPFSSRHKIENASAAAAAVFAAGLPLDRCLPGLADICFSPSRGDRIEAGGIYILNDTYNASPVSMHAALDELLAVATERNGRPVAILGDMLELGAESERYHRQVGRYAAEAGVKLLWGLGDRAKAMVDGYRAVPGAFGADRNEAEVELEDETRCGYDPDVEHGAVRLLGSLRRGDVVLVKASRALRLERVVEAIVRLTESKNGEEGTETT
jgi:UDP-N-acetylmuramoyl-tripeptide--D-alanyl-D-alanine ligase